MDLLKGPSKPSKKAPSKSKKEVWKPEYQESRFRITSQTSTGVSPAELLLGRNPRSRVRLHHSVQKEKHDLHVKKCIVKEGDKVLARNFCQGPKWMPGIMQQSNGSISLKVELEDGRKWR